VTAPSATSWTVAEAEISAPPITAPITSHYALENLMSGRNSSRTSHANPAASVAATADAAAAKADPAVWRAVSSRIGASGVGHHEGACGARPICLVCRMRLV
jgi:hypothetical protein